MKRLLILTLSWMFYFTSNAQTGVSDDFEDGNITGWSVPSWLTSNYTLSFQPNNTSIESRCLRVSANTTGVGWPYFVFQFPAINMTDNPYVSIKVRAGTNTAPLVMRIDVVDVNGRTNNNTEVRQTITTDARFNEYTFSYTDFFHRFGPPSAGPQDVTRINRIFIYLNPGSETTPGFFGDILIDDVKIGDQAVLVSNSNLVGIKLNQIGFFPNGEKIAVVNGGNGSTFEVISEDGSQVFYIGNLSTAVSWAPSGEIVKTANFSSFTTPGRYKIRVNGLANPSYSFVISDKIYNTIEKAAIKMYYYQRASTALPAQYAGTWARAAGHADVSVLVHASAATVSRPTNTIISSPKGWYDAGDYNKYIVNSGISTYTLLAAYEHFTPYFDTLSLNIPENNNALPDILDEVLWNLEWMLTMQDPADGGVYHKLTNPNFDGTVMPANATAARYVVQKSTAAALNFAAVMAQAARVFSKFEAQKPGFSSQCIAAAIRAYQWALNNPAVYYVQSTLNVNFNPDINTGEYGDNNVSDEFNWAAAELFVTTKNPSYYADYSPTMWADTPSWPGTNMLGIISLNHYRKQIYTVVDTTVLRNRLLSTANNLRNHATSTSAYKIAMGGNNNQFNWGSNSIAANQSLVLLQAFYYTKDSSYLRAAIGNMDYLLGRNPLNYCYVTGFGTKSPVNPHHRPMEADNILAPIPGYLVGGPYPGQPESGCSYPSTLPALSYTDLTCSYSTNEIAINWNAPLVYNLGSIQALHSGIEPDAFTFVVNQPTNTASAILKDATIRVYPVPSSDKVYVDMPYTVSGSIELVNVHGQVYTVKTSSATATLEIPVQGLESGVYVLKIPTTSGIAVEKIVIQ
ncbi:MAG: glycoside hydrolase family 9 protein [Cytophagaceae bacterium]|nr:glycoside hydrolase family 9 protein [Cytophagaceae bacterium]